MSQFLNLPAGHPARRPAPAAAPAALPLQPVLDLAARLARALAAALHNRLARVRLRRAARQMLSLPDATLRDIGVSRWEIAAAVRSGRPIERRGARPVGD